MFGKTGSVPDQVGVVVWRAVIFVLAAAAILGLEQVAHLWLLSGEVASQSALDQLRPSDEAAESLRLVEFGRRSLWVLSHALILGVGAALFVPLPRLWLQRWREHCNKSQTIGDLDA